MKIVAVRGSNLASLAHPFEIDFEREPLAHAGVFAISGATGAGKTTLLDAICVALYHQTPRLSAGAHALTIPDAAADQGLSARDPRQLLRRGTAWAFAEVDFRGVDGQLWRARWEVKRAHGRREGRLQAAEGSLVHIGTGERHGRTLTEVRQHIEQRIGLGFAQFSRAVLLAQGEFAAFLRAAASERAELLEALTGLERYSQLSVLAYERAAEGARGLELLRAQAGQLPLFDDAERAQRTVQLDQLDHSLESQQVQLDATRAQLDWCQRAAVNAAALDAAASAAAAAEREVLEAAPARMELERWERGARAAPLLAALDRAVATTAVVAIEQQALRDALEQSASQEAHALAALARYEAVHAEAHAAHQLALPQIAAARRLDAGIGAQRAALQALASPLARASAALQRHQGQEATLSAEHARLLAACDQRASAMRPLERLEPLLAEWPALHLQLAAWRSQTALLVQLAQQIDVHDVELGRLAERKAGLERAFAAQQAVALHAEQALQDATAAWAGVDAAGLAQAEDSAQRLQLALTRATAALAGLQQARRECAACESEAQALAAQLQQARAELATLALHLPLRTTSAAQARLRHQRARDASDARTQMLRAQLAAGEPCPVCGATTHPWQAHGGSPLDAALDELAAAEREAQAALAQDTQAQAAHRATERTLEARAQTLAQHRREREQALTAAVDSWQAAHSQLAALAPLAAAEDSGEAAALAAAEAELHRRDEWLADWRARLAGASLQREQALQASALARSALAPLQQDLADTAVAHAALQLERAGAATRRGAALTQLADAQSALRAHGAWPVLQEHIADAPSAALIATLDDELRTLQRLRAEYRQAATEASQVAQSLAHAAQERSAVLEPDLARLQAQHARLSAACEALAAQRRDALAAVDVEAHALALETAVTQAQIAVHEAREERQRVHQLVAERTAQWQALVEREAHAARSVADSEAALHAWWQPLADGATLAIDTLRAWAAVGADARQARTQFLDALHASALAAAQRLADRQTERAQLQEAPERPHTSAELLAAELAAGEHALASMREQRGALRQQLADDDARRQRLGRLREELATAEARERVWAQLNQLIGSKSGDKFRRIAQQYTLDLVLAYANQHLAELAPRYRVQRQEFELLVVDGDMGDELRATNSLSGGETFLLSLALALGLASLAAQRVRVESLFIDEGFGSLDQDTLRIAVDALDRLQAQGRQIGVISHVAELTERVAVRIRVRRQGHGRSVVEVPV